MTVLRRVCLRHGWLGWSYNTSGRRRWCRFCAYPERWDEATGRWVGVA